MSGKMSEIPDGDGFVPNLSCQMTHFLMRAFEKVVQQTQFIHDFKSRRMDGVAAEVAKKVGVLFEHHRVHTHPGEEKAQHHASGTAPDDAATRLQGFAHPRAMINLNICES